MEYISGDSDRGSIPWCGYFQDLSARAKPYCEVKCSQGLHFPATLFVVKQHSGSMSLKSNEGMRPTMSDKSVETLDSKIRFSASGKHFSPFPPKQC